MPAQNLMMKKPFTSRHFHIEQLEQGVYAVINAEEGWAICNAGIIDLGDRTLVFDAFTSPQAASDLCEAAETLTGRPVHTLVNSHYHNDHIWGNQAFDPKVTIISTGKTRQLIQTEGAAEVNDYRAMAPARLAALEKQLAESDSETVRQELKPMIFDYQAIVAALPILQVRLPNLTFDKELSIFGSKRSARLIAYDNAHCASDVILYLPEDGIVFTEDILFIGCHPYLGDGDPIGIQRVLGDIKKLHPTILVPGHGPVGKIEQLDILDGYIRQLQTLATNAVEQGTTEKELEKVTIPQEYQNYIVPIFFSANLKFMVKRLLGQ